MKKKLLLAAMLSAAVLATGAVVACKDNGEGETPSVTYEVTLANESLIMTVGDERALLAECGGQASATLTYESSDPTVVAVDEYGKLTAIKEGTATITARYGDAKDTCSVTVSLNGMLPSLQLPNVPSNEICLDKASELNLKGTATFNGKTYEDVTLSYELSDPTVGEIKNGAFKPLKSGTTTITIVGTWRGVSGSAMTKTISVEILPEFLLSVNEGVSEIKLCTETNTSSPFVVTAQYDGAALETTVEITSGSEYISYDAENKTVSGRGIAGEAEITISYVLDGVAKEKVITVKVERSLYEYATTVTNFSAIHGDTATGATLAEILGADVLYAYDAAGNALEVKDNKVYGVQSSADGKFATELTVYSETRGYVLDIEGYTGVFAKASDFAVFNMNVAYGKETYEDGSVASSKSFYAIDKTKPMQKWEGYYVLANNIDATGYEHAKVGVDLNTRGIQSGGYHHGFFGTFDGQGYTVKNMTVGAYGIFGYLNGATLKNVAFADVTLNNETGSSVLAAWIMSSTLTDVYISVANESELGKTGSVLASGVNESEITRCIVETKAGFGYVDGLESTGSFTFQSREYNRDDAIKTAFTDVYVISGEVLGYYKAGTYYLQAENETLEIEEGYKTLTFEGVRRYATFADMQADTENNYGGFADNANWTTENGAPVWSTLNGEYPPVEEDSGDSGESGGTGDSGESGGTGDSGESGGSGDSGESGGTGDSGESGGSGDSGESGGTGDSGESGGTGDSGESGGNEDDGQSSGDLTVGKFDTDWL